MLAIVESNANDYGKEDKKAMGFDGTGKTKSGSKNKETKDDGGRRDDETMDMDMEDSDLEKNKDGGDREDNEDNDDDTIWGGCGCHQHYGDTCALGFIKGGCHSQVGDALYVPCWGGCYVHDPCFVGCWR